MGRRVFRTLLVVGFWTLGVGSAGAGSLEYRFSFGDELILRQDPQRVALSITNESDQALDCDVAGLLDGTSPDPLLARIVFLPVPGQDDCISDSCLVLPQPPPRIALWAPVGPFAPGQTRTCAFDVSVVSPLGRSIVLTGSAGPIEVREGGPEPVPALGYSAVVLLCLAIFAGFAYRRRAG